MDVCPWLTQGGYPAKAMSLVNARPTQFGQDMLEKIAAALAAAGMHDKAGSVLEQMGRPERALEAFIKGNAYRSAVELARRNFPSQVVGLENKWGDYLVSQKQVRVAVVCFGLCTDAGNCGCNRRQRAGWTCS